MTDRKDLSYGQLGARWLFIATIVVGFVLIAPRLARYVFSKEANLCPAGVFSLADLKLSLRINADSKLIAAYHVGTRDAGCAYEFMTHLSCGTALNPRDASLVPKGSSAQFLAWSAKAQRCVSCP
jgi:hypothetical protein